MRHARNKDAYLKFARVDKRYYVENYYIYNLADCIAKSRGKRWKHFLIEYQPNMFWSTGMKCVKTTMRVSTLLLHQNKNIFTFTCIKCFYLLPFFSHHLCNHPTLCICNHKLQLILRFYYIQINCRHIGDKSTNIIINGEVRKCHVAAQKN